MGLRMVQRTAAGTGPPPSFRGARVLELIPPVRSVLMRSESHGDESDTNKRGAR